MALLASASTLLACERHITVGTLESNTQAEGGAQNSPGLPDTLVFESRFEQGSLSEWGEPGPSLTTAGGEISVQGETVHGGLGAAQITTTTTGEHVVLNVGGEWSEVLIGFYVFVAAQYQTGNWPILHIDAQTDGYLEQLWDIGLDASSGEGYQLFLWEMPAVSGLGEGAVAARTEEAFLPMAWTHIQVHLRAAADGTGFLRLYLNENLALDLSDRRAGNGDPLHLGFGSFAFGLEPRPADLYFDDVTVHVP